MTSQSLLKNTIYTLYVHIFKEHANLNMIKIWPRLY